MENITSRYMKCADVEISLYDPTIPCNYVYLCCYDQHRATLAPVDWAPVRHGRATFRQVGINVLYFPACYVHGKMEPAGEPFILSAGGACRYMTVCQEAHDTVILHIKNPYRAHILVYAHDMLNGRFQVAGRSDLLDTVTIRYRHDPSHSQSSILRTAGAH
jgi:hypothetical protein